MATQQENKLQLLRDILLIDDRQVAEAINQRIKTVSETIEQRDKLSEKIDPILDAKLKEFVKEMPNTLGPTITKVLEEQVANSRDQIVEALYPVLGKMVKRYIQNEIRILTENINKKVNKTFSTKSFSRKFKSFFTGVKESELVLSELDEPKATQIFAIQKGSGILLGSHSLTTTLDKDMISGMLTAIKSFVEDAFEAGNQNLEAIEYELFSIHVQNFHSYYIAAVVSGTYTRSFENKLEDKLLKLSLKLSPKIDLLSRDEIDEMLFEFFKQSSI